MTNRKTLLKLTLALACSAAILWLGVGCGEEIDPDYPCGREALIHAIQVREVLGESRPLFARLPNESRGKMMEHFFRDVDGNWSDEYGIVLYLDEKFNQETQPPENRIPDEIDGVSFYLMVGTNNYSSGFAVQYEEIPEFHYADAVMLKHEDLLMRQPNRTFFPFAMFWATAGGQGSPCQCESAFLLQRKSTRGLCPRRTGYQTVWKAYR